MISKAVQGAIQRRCEVKEVKAVLKYLIAPDADCHLDKKQQVQLLHDRDTLRARLCLLTHHPRELCNACL